MPLFSKADHMRVIEAAALTLEPQTVAHADVLFDILNDPAIYEYENQPPPTLEWLRARLAKLESRRSPDGAEHWLNWVIRLRDGDVIGYVQATVQSDTRRAAIAYVLASAYWGQGFGTQAIQAMIAELNAYYKVRRLTAVLKRENYRSLRLLERLQFSCATRRQHTEFRVGEGELLMLRNLQRQSIFAA